MKALFITNARIITPNGILTGYTLQLQEGKIAAVLSPTDASRLPSQADIFDARGAYAAPGFIDPHIHGFAGFGPELATQEALLRMSEELARAGVTGFCPTLYCGQPAAMESILKNTVGAFGRERGAHLLGYHLEGPFISPRKPGVMKPEDIAPASLSVLERLYEAAQGHIAAMTIAPELADLDGIIAFCHKRHILLQAGHTNATYEEFLRGAERGITHTTHLFNAMSPFNHRAPGSAGAVLLHPQISAEIIADGVHVHPDIVAFLHQVKPVENIVLVTDALLPTGQTQGPFLANGEEVVFQQGVWKRACDGVIAGSALTMLQGIKNLLSFGYTLPQAACCASTNAARLLALKNKGTLASGIDADITLFDDSWHVVQTFINGRPILPTAR